MLTVEMFVFGLLLWVFKFNYPILRSLGQASAILLSVVNPIIDVMATYYFIYAFYVLTDANRSGVAHEAVQNTRRASKATNEQEARQILGISERSSWEEVIKRYEKLFERNSEWN